jgi:hypothetical protein
MMDSQKWLNTKVQVDVSADRTGRPVAYIYDISCKGNHLRPIAKCTRSRGSHPLLTPVGRPPPQGASASRSAKTGAQRRTVSGI